MSGDPTRPPEHRVPPSAVIVFYAILGGGGYLVGRALLGVDPLRPFPEVESVPIRDLALGAGVGLAVVLISRILDRYFEWSRALTRSFKDILGRIRPSDTVILAVASSVGEELLFRGVLLPKLGLVVSSLLFGLIHGFSPGDRQHMLETAKRFLPLIVAATLMGFAFGLMVEYTGSILAAVIAHFTINYLNLNEMYRSDWEAGEGGESDG